MAGGDDIAVLLNGRAGKVRPKVVQRLAEAIPRGRIHLCRSFEELDAAVEDIDKHGARVVLSGGGDGTLQAVVRRLARLRSRPALGLLGLGTGNALSYWAGCGPWLDDVHRWVAGEDRDHAPLRLVELGEDLVFFAGFGWDAALLDDYHSVKRIAPPLPFTTQINAVALYLFAVATRTAPRMNRSEARPRVRIEVLDGEATPVDVRGLARGPTITAGALLYEGEGPFVGLSTTPFYGSGVRMFPPAETDPERFCLRVGAMSPWDALNDLPRLWRGTWEHPKLFDFLVRDVRIRFDRPAPLQQGGDPAGTRTEVRARYFGALPFRTVQADPAESAAPGART